MLIAESMRSRSYHPLAKIMDVNKDFRLGNVIKMENSLFLVQEEVSETMAIIVPLF